MKNNMLIIHGGAPTAVINASLYGAVNQASKSKLVNKIYGAIGGTGGAIKEHFFDFSGVNQRQLDLLLQTPGSAIGTSRDALKEEDYLQMVDIFVKHNIRYVLVNGGNGSMDTCGKIKHAVGDREIFVMGIPKTIDNDIAVTDHAPGFGSAARYIAATVGEVAEDVQSLPIHVSIIEAMGRNTGWITAASALARTKNCGGPDLIYLPEKAFDESAFLARVETLHHQKGGVVVACSEGLRGKDGKPIVDPIFRVGRSVYYGDTSAHLANLIIKELGFKARSEKPGICGRASIAYQSSLDRKEAIIAGQQAVKAVLEEKTGFMIGFKRSTSINYVTQTCLIPIEEVMLAERTMPDEFISPQGDDVTDEFLSWCRPLIGEPLPEYIRFNRK